MKDTGVGVVRNLTARIGSVYVEQWDMANFQPGFVRAQGTELYGNDFPCDLTELLRLGDRVKVTAMGKRRGVIYCVLIDVLTPNPDPAVHWVKGIVRAVRPHDAMVQAQVEGAQVQVVLPDAAFLAPACTPFHCQFSHVLKRDVPVVMKVAQRRVRGNVVYGALSARLLSDPDRFLLPGETAAGDGPARSPANNGHDASNAPLDASTQTPPLMQQALRAAQRFTSDAAVTQRDVTHLWTLCPTLVKMVYYGK